MSNLHKQTKHGNYSEVSIGWMEKLSTAELQTVMATITQHPYPIYKLNHKRHLIS